MKVRDCPRVKELPLGALLVMYYDHPWKGRKYEKGPFWYAYIWFESDLYRLDYDGRGYKIINYEGRASRFPVETNKTHTRRKIERVFEEHWRGHIENNPELVFRAAARGQF